MKAYVKRNKHDLADAEAIGEAVRRPSMRFVPVKTAEQQSALIMHRARELLIRQRTMPVKAIKDLSGVPRDGTQLPETSHGLVTAFALAERIRCNGADLIAVTSGDGAQLSDLGHGAQ